MDNAQQRDLVEERYWATICPVCDEHHRDACPADFLDERHEPPPTPPGRFDADGFRIGTGTPDEHIAYWADGPGPHY